MIRSDGAGSSDELRTPFVERRTYRRRRLMDIARLAPIIGALLFMIPLLWPQPEASDASAQTAYHSMSGAMIYIFSVWAALVVFSVGFSRAVRQWAVHWTGGRALPGEPEPPGVAQNQHAQRDTPQEGSAAEKGA